MSAYGGGLGDAFALMGEVAKKRPPRGGREVGARRLRGVDVFDWTVEISWKIAPSSPGAFYRVASSSPLPGLFCSI